jgi:phosphate transport system permease protein
MVEMSLSETMAATGQSKPRVTPGPMGDRVLHALTFSSAVLVLLVLGGVFISLVHGSLPALQAFGFGFITTETWNPATDVFGAAAPI